MVALDQGIPAGTPVWIIHPHAGIKAGTAAVTVTACTRQRHGEPVTVRLESGRESVVSSYSITSMLAEEIPAWASDRPTSLPQGGK